MKGNAISGKTVLVLIALALFAVPLASFANTEALTFETNRYLANEAIDEAEPDIAVVGSGATAMVYVVHEKREYTGTHWHVMFKRSDDGGETFPADADHTEDFFPGTVVDGDKYSKPTIAVRGDLVCLIYLDNTYRGPSGFPAQNVLTAQISSDKGVTWTEHLITPLEENVVPSSTMNHPHVTIDPLGNIYVVYVMENRIWISYSLDSGSTWSIPETVADIQSADNPAYFLKHPNVASNGQYIVVTFWGDINYWKQSWFVRASKPVYQGQTFSFSAPSAYSVKPLEQGYFPRVVARSSTIHGLLWDFSTEAGYTGDFTDKAAISYTASYDNGQTFTSPPGSSHPQRVIVNQTKGYWHSQGDIDVNTNGYMAVAWFDYMQITNEGKRFSGVFVSESNDGGKTWSYPDRVSNYNPTAVDCYIPTGGSEDHRSPRIAVDEAGNSYIVWTQYASATTYVGDIRFSRSLNPNTDPTPVENLFAYKDPDDGDKLGHVDWSINRDPDFKEYSIHYSKVEDFIPDYRPIPEGTMVYNSTDQSLQSLDLVGLEASTDYYVKIVVHDTMDAKGVSEEVHFKTDKTNERPVWNVPEPFVLHMQEDSDLREAINFTDWIEKGNITDDQYYGHEELWFKITSLNSRDNVTTRIRIYPPLNETYTVLDLLYNRSLPNYYSPFGKPEQFMMWCYDTGKDGAAGNLDDIGSPHLLQIYVDGINDVPTWNRFGDSTLAMGELIPPIGTFLNTTKWASVFAIQDSEYEFFLQGEDLDKGDFLTFSCTDPRVRASPNVQYSNRFDFSITPSNEDVPYLNLTIVMTDGNGGDRTMNIVITVIDVNDDPVVLFINDDEQDPRVAYDLNDPITFEMYEESRFEFTLTADDADPLDVLTLTSTPPDKVRITKGTKDLYKGFWRINVTSGNDDKVIEFKLTVRDSKQALPRIQGEVPIRIEVINTPDPPQWSFPQYDEPRYIGDENDRYEFGGDIKPGGEVIRAEWGETVRFKANAFDTDLDDVLNYTWSFFRNNQDRTPIGNYYGRTVDVRFYPEDGILYNAQMETILINISVSDGVFPPLDIGFSITVWPDEDNDNDGLPDIREEFFYQQLLRSLDFKDFDPNAKVDLETYLYEEWKAEYRGQIHSAYYDLLTDEVRKDFLLLLNNTSDPDRDGYSSYYEIGTVISLSTEELRPQYSLNMDLMDPLNPDCKPGEPWNPSEPEGIPPPQEIESWVWMLIFGVLVAVVIIITGFIVILRWNKKKEEQEDAEIEQRIKDQEKRAAEINTLYGGKYKAGETVGPDQTTLDDLKLDLGGAIYHEEGSGGIVDEAGHKKKQQEQTGPRWQAAGGPLFEKSAAKLEFGESLQLETIGHEADTGEMDHSGIDEDGLEDSFEEIMDAAESYDEKRMSQSGGQVQIGAMTLEQLEQQKQGGFGGPRAPPPGQEPPTPMTQPPGPAPPRPGMPPVPRPLQKKED